MVQAIIISVAIVHTTKAIAATTILVGIGWLEGAEGVSATLSNKSQSAFKNKKPPKLKFITI